MWTALRNFFHLHHHSFFPSIRYFLSPKEGSTFFYSVYLIFASIINTFCIGMFISFSFFGNEKVDWVYIYDYFLSVSISWWSIKLSMMLLLHPLPLQWKPIPKEPREFGPNQRNAKNAMQAAVFLLSIDWHCFIQELPTIATFHLISGNFFPL